MKLSCSRLPGGVAVHARSAASAITQVLPVGLHPPVADADGVGDVDVGDVDVGDGDAGDVARFQFGEVLESVPAAQRAAKGTLPLEGMGRHRGDAVQRKHRLHHAPGGAKLGDGEEAAQAVPVGWKELSLDHQRLGIVPLGALQPKWTKMPLFCSNIF
jgi:hypothetical protein